MNAKKITTSLKDPDTGEKFIYSMKLDPITSEISEILMDKELDRKINDLIELKYDKYIKTKIIAKNFENLKNQMLKNFQIFLVFIFDKYGKDYLGLEDDRQKFFQSVHEIVLLIIDEIRIRGDIFTLDDIYLKEYPLAILIAFSEQVGGKYYAESLINEIENNLGNKQNFYKDKLLFQYLMAFIQGFRGKLNAKDFKELLDNCADSDWKDFLDHLLVFGALFNGVDIEKIYKGKLLKDVKVLNAVMQGKQFDLDNDIDMEALPVDVSQKDMYEGAKSLTETMKMLNFSKWHYRYIVRIAFVFAQSVNVIKKFKERNNEGDKKVDDVKWN